VGGSLSLTALAARLDVGRTRELTRRVNPKTGKGRDGVVTKLEAAGIVEVDGEAVTLVDEWLEALNEERERSGEIELFRRDMARYNREREAYRRRAYHSRDKAQTSKPSAAGLEAVRRSHETAAEHRREHLIGWVEQSDERSSFSPLAEAVRDYLDKNPADARRSPYWIGTTLWAHDLFDGKPTPEETKAAIEELGGAAYLDEALNRAKGAA
jgi:hypothetical protein